MYKRSPLASAISLALATSFMGMGPQVLAQEDLVEDEQPMEEVIVTGSRIRKDVFSSTSPIDIIITENASVQGISDLGNLLQTSTIAAGAPQVTAATSSAFVENGGIGATTISLRGLGANRTLNLINGRRAGPAGTRGGVSSFDLNVIPLVAIERIEILKDGASSIYGSDAVAGVVNIYTKKESGGTIDAYIMQPSSSGGEETRLSATWGMEGARGNFRLTGDYYESEELARGDRPHFACAEQYIFDDAGNRRDVIDPRRGGPACRDALWGHVWLYDYQDGGNVPTPRRTLAQFDYDNDLGQYIPGIAVDPDDSGFLVTPPGWFLVSYDRLTDGVTNMDHPFQDAQTMVPEIERTTFFADGELLLGDTLTAYTEVLLNRRKTTANDYRQFWGYVYNEQSDFFGTNPLSVGWQGNQWLSPTPITDHFDKMIEVDYQRYMAGLRGDINENLYFDVSYQYSKSDGDYSQDVIFDDSISDQNWLGGSCTGSDTSVRGVPCQDIPWLDAQFLAGNVSPEMREFLFGHETGNTEYTQSSVEAYIAGEAFEMPAGDLGVAFGVAFAQDEINDVPGEVTLAGNSWGLSSAGITAGDQETTAVFGEIDVPLLRDRTGFKDLTLNVSGRWTDVDTYGDGTTYKVGLNWQIVDSFRVRGNQGTSFRTPALFELYLADQTSFVRQSNIDPCILWGQALAAGDITQRVADNCAADTSAPGFPGGLPPDFTGGTVTATAISSGGLGLLEAETSTANTVGFVWQPKFADLSVAVDYFDIEVEDQVDQLGANGIAFGCYNSEFYPNEQLCTLFDRSGLNGGIDNVRNSFINVATQTTSGYDLTVRYVAEVFGGVFEIDTQHTFTNERKTALFEGFDRDELGEFGNPEWVGRLWLTFDHGPWSYFWGMRYVDDVSNVDSFEGTTATYRGETVNVVLEADAVTYHDFSITYNHDRWGLRTIVGLSNVFDEDPPNVTTLPLGELETAGTAAFYSQYDWLGRRFFLNLTKAFE